MWHPSLKDTVTRDLWSALSACAPGRRAVLCRELAINYSAKSDRYLDDDPREIPYGALTFRLAPPGNGRHRLYIYCPACDRLITVGRFHLHARIHQTGGTT